MSKVEQSSGTQFSAWLVHQAGALIKQGMAVVVMGVGMYWTGVDVIAGRLPPGDFVAIAAYVAQVRSRAVAAHLLHNGLRTSDQTVVTMGLAAVLDRAFHRAMC